MDLKHTMGIFNRQFFAELIGTFFLVFCGTGAIIINDVSEGAISHAGIAVTFGLVVMILIYALGAISGAHMNPAVSIAFSMTKLFDKKNLLPYILAQTVGALLASGVLYLLFLEDNDTTYLGATLPHGSWYQSFILEVILTYLLMFVILFVSQHKTLSSFTGVMVGMTVLLEAMFAGPITGASMNPVRSLSPALVSGNVHMLWIYLVAPTLGAILAMFTWKFLKEKDN